MDGRILFAVVTLLVVAACGGFYVALVPHANDALIPPGQRAALPAAAPASLAPAPLRPLRRHKRRRRLRRPPWPRAGSVEAEIALSEYADVAALLKKNFAAEYDDLIAALARRKNEGVSDKVFGDELAERVQQIMRGKLKYGAGASMATIDRLAANEASLFHALGTEGAAFCLKMLGKDDTPAAAPPPESVRRMMGLGTLYRFQAIAEGLPNAKPVEPLKTDEMKAFEASLAREGINLQGRQHRRLSQGNAEPGKPCLTLETLHLAIARLPEANTPQDLRRHVLCRPRQVNSGARKSPE